MTERGHETSARTAYGHSAEMYATEVGTELSARFETALDRALLEAFVETIASFGSGPVLDIGCGSGRVAAVVAQRGLEAHGIDVAPQMITEARAAHPHIRFDVGTLTKLPVPDSSVDGAIYSRPSADVKGGDKRIV